MTREAPRPPRCTSQRIKTALAAALIALGLIALPLTLASCDSGTVAVGKSVIERVLPGDWRTMWAASPQPDTYIGSYDDATGQGENYVYDVQAADSQGRVKTVTIVSFGSKASGEGYLQLDVKGSSGVHYHAVETNDVPADARAAIEADSASE